LEKAVEVLEALRSSTNREIVLIGAPKEKEFVEEVLSRVSVKSNIHSVAGTTSLVQLTEILASARVMLSTDSGPAHLANALGTYTVVLFGAGNEKHTAPYDELLRTVIRLGELSCEPCEKNVCVRYGTPQCLVQLNTAKIIETVNQHT
jgi:ADP-heptose:LPS heptosyltransferase